MKCGDIKDDGRKKSDLDNLDDALHELGMLSTITDVRRDFLKENKTSAGIMRMNTRFVSNVTLGFCMKKTSHKNRVRPYNIPVRNRTKSENSDTYVNVDIADITNSGGNICDTLMQPSCSYVSFVDPKVGKVLKNKKKTLTKKCQSLENISAAVETAEGAQPAQEMDCVSNRIKKLQVNE